MKCAVGKCKENNSRPTTASFYHFPKDEVQRKLWVKFCNRVKPVNVRKERICSLHFKEEDYERNLKFEMGFSNRRTPKLKQGVVPSIEPSAIKSEIKIENKTETETRTANKSAILNVTENQIEFYIY